MRIKDSDCVSCHSELGCIGNLCPRKKVEYFFCDLCEDAPAEYRIDMYDMCSGCADSYLQEKFEELSIQERCSALGIDYEEVY